MIKSIFENEEDTEKSSQAGNEETLQSSAEIEEEKPQTTTRSDDEISQFSAEKDSETSQTPFEENVSEETPEAIKNELEQMNEAAEQKSVEAEVNKEVRQIFSKIVQLPHEETQQNQDTQFFFETKAANENPPLIYQPESRTPLDQIFSGINTDEKFPDNPPLTNNSTNQNASESPIVIHHESQSVTAAETIRQSGLAWSAAIGLFGSVLFMLILGWIVDVLTGASPVGIVVGVIIGAAVGFYQFFRVTSMIFKK